MSAKVVLARYSVSRSIRFVLVMIAIVIGCILLPPHSQNEQSGLFFDAWRFLGLLGSVYCLIPGFCIVLSLMLNNRVAINVDGYMLKFISIYFRSIDFRSLQAPIIATDMFGTKYIEIQLKSSRSKLKIYVGLMNESLDNIYNNIHSLISANARS